MLNFYIMPCIDHIRFLPIMLITKSLRPLYFIFTVSLLELQSAMVTLLNVRNCGVGSFSNENVDSKTPVNCVHLMKYNVIDDMFQLKIGTERVALQTRLFSGEDSIFKTHEAFKGITFFEDFDIVMDKYLRRQLFTKYAKEHLGITLMMVAALHSSMMSMSSRKT